MFVQTSQRWDGVIDGLAAWLDELRPGVFDPVQVITSSPALARLAGQGLAARMGILAGVDLVPADRWVAQAQAGLGDGEPSPWRGHSLELAVREVLADPEFTAAHPVIRAHLATDPGRLRGAAQRMAHLLRQYGLWQPEMLARWAADPYDAIQQLPEHLTWQPELFLRVSEALEWDPVEEHERLQDHLADRPGAATAVLHCPELPRATMELLEALARTRDVPVFRIAGRDVWDSIDDCQPEPARPESISWLGSHGPARQAEVLREELCRILASDPALEPRDVLVVVPDVVAWWPALSLALGHTPSDPHPGRTLRLQSPAEVQPRNPVLLALAAATRLRDSRAEASAVLDLLGLPPIAHRWRLPERAELVELLEAAGIRWGLDAQHRADQGLPGVTQNTWARGLDRLLAGLALPAGSTALPLTGTDGIASSRLELIGTLSELISRLRRYATLTAEATPVAEWTLRAQRLMVDLVGLPASQESLLQEATERLKRLAMETAGNLTRIPAADFAHLLEELAAEPPSRARTGNGDLTVVSEGELAGAGFQVVALLGVEDRSLDYPPDALPETVPDPRRQRLDRLLRHARAARHLVVVHQHRTESTNAPREKPTALTWLWRQLGVTPEMRELPASATDEPNFLEGRPSFDAISREAAEIARSRGSVSTTSARRRAALSLPLSGDQPEMSLDEIVRFLRDPAAAFLRERAGIRSISHLEVHDDITLHPGGLEAWGIRSRLLAAARNGHDPAVAIQAEARRELLPAGALSATLIDRELELIRRLWLQARTEWERPLHDTGIDLHVAGMRLTGQARLRGGDLVVLSPSDLPRALYEPWVQVLALATAGVRTRARVHFLRRHYADHHADVVTITPPADASQHLEWLVRGARLARSRLVPVPAEPARVLASSQRSGRLNEADWQLPTTHWSSPWAWRARHWEHFYAGPAAELFTDPPGEFDPPGPARFGAFGAWAITLHAPLLEATG